MCVRCMPRDMRSTTLRPSPTGAGASVKTIAPAPTARPQLHTPLHAGLDPRPQPTSTSSAGRHTQQRRQGAPVPGLGRPGCRPAAGSAPEGVHDRSRGGAMDVARVGQVWSRGRHGRQGMMDGACIASCIRRQRRCTAGPRRGPAARVGASLLQRGAARRGRWQGGVRGAAGLGIHAPCPCVTPPERSARQLRRSTRARLGRGCLGCCMRGL